MYRLMCKVEDITHGQRFLLNLMDRRELAQFCRDLDLSIVFLFNVGIGKNLPPAETIYKLRHIIHPNSWFFRESEALTLHEYSEDTGETWNYTESKGYKDLLAIVEQKGDRNFAREYGFDYTSLWLILTGRRKPSFSKIRSYKDHVTPADWFYKE